MIEKVYLIVPVSKSDRLYKSPPNKIEFAPNRFQLFFIYIL